MYRACFFLGVALTLAAATAVERRPEPLRQRELTFELGPKPPTPELAARSDPGFALARRFTTVRQLSQILSAVLATAVLAWLGLSGAGRRVAGWARGRGFAELAVTASAVGCVVGLCFLAGEIARYVAARQAGADPALWASLVRALGVGVGAGALSLASFGARAAWARSWWFVVTAAVIAATALWYAFAGRYPHLSEPAGGHLAERARYLTTQYEMPAYSVAVYDRGPARRLIAAHVVPQSRRIVVTGGATALDRYETEVLLVGAVAEAAPAGWSLTAAGALIAFMASLLFAESAAAVVARRRGAKAVPAASLPVMAAAFAVFWLAVSPLFLAWNRAHVRAADEDAIRRTRKPIAATTLYFHEAAANFVADRPHAILHVLADASPSPAERAAAARRLRDELAK